MTGGRDITPALGHGGEPGRYRRAVQGAKVALAQRGWADARWSHLYGDDTRYGREGTSGEQVPEAARRARARAEPVGHVQGPVMKPAVWTWEVPLYFWFGGIASGSSIVAAACDLTGDHRSAIVARRVALGAAVPCAPLLIMDLGRPARFLNMLRIFKPRSPMSTGAWCMTAFTNLGAAAAGADLLGRPAIARRLGAGGAFLALYFGSYTAVLLASTAVPLWARSRLFLGPIFFSTALATGAAASRLVLVAGGLERGHPTRRALGTVETAAIAAELVLSSVNERRLGPVGDALSQGSPGRLFAGAKWAVRAGLAMRLVSARAGRDGRLGRRHRRGRRDGRGRFEAWPHHLASLLYLAAGLVFRYAWVGAGRASAGDDEAVARAARSLDGAGGRNPR